MTAISVLVANLQARGIVLSQADGQIKFRAPKDALTDADKDALRARRDDIIGFLAAREAGRGLRYLRGRPGPLTASVAQEMWWRFGGGPNEGKPVALNISTVGHFPGADPKDVVSAIQGVIRRHDTLRTHIRVEDEHLHLSLNDASRFVVTQNDLTQLSALDAAGAAEAQARQYCSELHPVEGDWLTRARIWKLPDGVLAAISGSHIVADAGSRNIIMNDLLDALGKGNAGHGLAIPYNDFSLAERDYLTGPQGEALIRYWRDWYADAPTMLSPALKTPLLWGVGTRLVNNFVMPRRMLASVRALAERLRTTPFAVHLTLFSMALGRWSRSEDFTVRILGDKRTSLELTNTVGLMFCADPIRVNAPADADFESVLRWVMKEYDASLALRLPSLHYYPPHAAMPGIEPVSHPVKIPAVFNYYSAGTEREKQVAVSAADETAEMAWPAPVQQMPPAAWTRPSAPVFLHLMDYGHKADCSMHFLRDVVSESEQQAFFETWFRIYQDIVPA